MSHHNCNIEKVYQFADGELAGHEREQVEGHLFQCAGCRDILRQIQQLSMLHHQFTQTREPRLAHPAMTAKALDRMHQGISPWHQRFQRYFPKWVTVPLATAVLLLALSLPWLLKENVKEPSAIITSLTSDSGSIIMFETPVSKQTVIWVAENSQ